MYTRCPQCSTIFRVTAAQLRAALGEVNCGSCHATFNALAALSDELPELTEIVVPATARPSSASPAADHEPTGDAGQRGGTGAGETSVSDRDSGPTAAAGQTNGPAATEPAYDDDTGIDELHGEDDAFGSAKTTATDGESADPLEFDAPEQSWSEIFAPTDEELSPATHAWTDDPETVPPREPFVSALATETADPEEWVSLLTELTGTDATPAGPFPESGPEADAHDEVDDEMEDDGPVVVLGSANEPNRREPQGPPGPATQGETIIAQRPDPLIDYSPDSPLPWEAGQAEEQTGETTASRSFLRFTIAAMLTLALGVQLVHYNRDALATHPTWGPRVNALYSSLGRPLYPDWNLDAYRVSGSEAVADRTAPAVLDIIATIDITGDVPVGLPLVRVALHDLWSNTVASRVFSPAEYLRDVGQQPALASPGTTLPIEISVSDPGPEARGYVVDVCLPRRSSGLQCQLEKNPFQQP